MKTKSHFIESNRSRLHYVSSGSGTEHLLFFHGFGQDHSIYLPLIQGLGPRYRVYIFDLYFHGKSEWGHGETPLSKGEWAATISQFLLENQIDRFSIVGYSLGGKFALSTLEAFAGRVNRVYLIAPDGIKTSFWYSMATYPILLRRFFKGMIGNYNRFSQIAQFLHRRNLVDSGLIRFADFQMGTEEKRKRVYYSWVVFRHLTFRNRDIADFITQNKIATTVIVGKYDKVILPENMNALLKYLPDAKLHILDCGHSGLILASLPYLIADTR